MKEYWVSWVQPTEDYRPLTYPPNESVLGWWCSGYTASEQPILCARLRAKSVREAKMAVRKDWPDAGAYRFFNSISPETSLSDRFPLSQWMIERMASIKAETL